MKRLVILTILKLFAKAILITIMIGIAIVIIGTTKKWYSSITYSNAFFIAGALMIVAGAFSRLAAGEDWNNFQLVSGESFRGMSSSERANYIIDASSSVSLLILGLLSGLLLILLSVLVTKMF